MVFINRFHTKYEHGPIGFAKTRFNKIFSAAPTQFGFVKGNSMGGGFLSGLFNTIKHIVKPIIKPVVDQGSKLVHRLASSLISKATNSLADVGKKTLVKLLPEGLRQPASDMIDAGAKGATSVGTKIVDNLTTKTAKVITDHLSGSGISKINLDLKGSGMQLIYHDGRYMLVPVGTKFKVYTERGPIEYYGPPTNKPYDFIKTAKMEKKVAKPITYMQQRKIDEELHESKTSGGSLQRTKKSKRSQIIPREQMRNFLSQIKPIKRR